MSHHPRHQCQLVFAVLSLHSFAQSRYTTHLKSDKKTVKNLILIYNIQKYSLKIYILLGFYFLVRNNRSAQLMCIVLSLMRRKILIVAMRSVKHFIKQSIFLSKYDKKPFIKQSIFFIFLQVKIAICGFSTEKFWVISSGSALGLTSFQIVSFLFV